MDGDEISDFEEEQEPDKRIPQNQRESVVVPPSSGATMAKTGNGKADVRQLMSMSTQNPGPSSSTAARGSIEINTEQMSDDELANMPHVKNLFNRFWEEKMKELKKDNVRIEQRNDKILNLQEKERRKSSSANQDTGFNDARAKTDRMVLEAEKFRVSVVNLEPGKDVELLVPNSNDQQLHVQSPFMQQQNMLLQERIPEIGCGVSDDDFFHLTCHIDPNLFHKIEKGEFVELEKLLPKDKIAGKEDNR